MSKSYQHNTHKSFTSALPNIVANYQTTMCNPSKNTKPLNRPSKIPVPVKTSRSTAKQLKIQPPVSKVGTRLPLSTRIPVSTAKQACRTVRSAALPADKFVTPANARLAKYKIPKLTRDSSNASNASLPKHKSRAREAGSNQSRITSVKSSRIPTKHLSKPKLSQLPKPKPRTISPKLKCHVVKPKSHSTTTFIAKLSKPSRSKVPHQNNEPRPYGIPPCSRYQIKWGDPAYTGSHKQGEWWYDTVGAAPRPMGWPDSLDIFPDVPSGMFEARPVEARVVPSEQLVALDGKKTELAVCTPFSFTWSCKSQVVINNLQISIVNG